MVVVVVFTECGLITRRPREDAQKEVLAFILSTNRFDVLLKSAIKKKPNKH